MTDVLTLRVPGKPQYVGAVRMTAASLASGAGFDIEAIEDIKVAISEACTNIVLHGSGGEGSELFYDVRFELEEKGLAICVEDEGVGYNMEDYEEPEPGERETGGGLGLFIIRALMDDVDIRSEVGVGTFICMRKYLEAAAV